MGTWWLDRRAHGTACGADPGRGGDGVRRRTARRRRWVAVVASSGALLSGGVVPVVGAPLGSTERVDTGYGRDGVAEVDLPGFDVGTDVVAAPDGGSVVAGFAGRSAALVRLTREGRVDGRFGRGGIALVDVGAVASAVSVVPVPGGAFVLSATVERSVGAVARVGVVLVRVTRDGRLDRSFGDRGIVTWLPDPLAGAAVDSVAADVAATRDGRPVVLIWSGTGAAVVVVARFTLGGEPDDSFGAAGTTVVSPPTPGVFPGGLVVQPDDGVVAGWTLSELSLDLFLPPSSDFMLTRLDGRGIVDARFGTGGLARADSGGPDHLARLIGLDDGTIVAFGDSMGTLVGAAAGRDISWRATVARFTAAGAIDATFGTNGVSRVVVGEWSWGSAIARGPGGSLLVVLQTARADEWSFEHLQLLVRLTAAGAVDDAFGSVLLPLRLPFAAAMCGDRAIVVGTRERSGRIAATAARL